MHPDWLKSNVAICLPIFVLPLLVAMVASGNERGSPTSSGSVDNALSHPVVGDQAPAADPDAQIETFFEAYFDAELAYKPEEQTLLGLKTEDYGKWNDRSDAAVKREIQRHRRWLDALNGFKRESLKDGNQLSYDLLEFALQSRLNDLADYRHYYVVDQFNGQITDRVSLLLNQHTIGTEQDARDYISRIQGLGPLFSDTAERLRDRARFGVVTPSFAFPDILVDIGGLARGSPLDASGEPHVLMADLAQKLQKAEFSSQLQAALLADAGHALRGSFNSGLAELVGEIERQSGLAQGSKGVWSLPDGEAFYASRIRAFTTIDISAEEVHRRGLEDIQRIHEEMQAIMKTLGFKGSLQAFFEFVRTDPSNFYPNTDAGREEFLAVARQQTAEIFSVASQYFHTLPRARLEVRRVEPWRENSTSIAFYQGPSEDGTRPGYYYANLRDMSSYQKSVATAITYHEGVPGHHFQIALAQELENLPTFRKHLGYGAYTEGWALYAERLAREMGFYADPLSDFGRLHDEIWRSARLVIDTGIHAMRWTREEAIDFFRQNTPLSEGDMVTEVERFFVNPGQALGYKIGMMKILELRSRAQSALGQAYDIRDFHDVVIGQGAMPLPILEAQVLRYIESKLSSR